LPWSHPDDQAIPTIKMSSHRARTSSTCSHCFC
jgi:hypothetical protein